MDPGPSPSAHTPPFQTNASAAPPAVPTFLDPSLAALHDFLSGSAPSPHPATHSAGSSAIGAGSPGHGDSFQPPPQSGDPSYAASPASANFADLLAEFTLPANVLSPDALGRTPGAGGDGMSGPEEAGGAAGLVGAKSAHEILMEQLRLPYPAHDSPAAAPTPAQLQEDLQMQLQQLLAGGYSTSETPTPTLERGAAHPPAFMPPPHMQQPTNGGSASNPYSPQSPAAFSHPSSSQHASPMSAYAQGGPAYQPQAQHTQPPPAASGSSTPNQANFAPQAPFPQAFQQVLGQFQSGAAMSNAGFLSQQLQGAPFSAQVAAFQLLMGAQMQAQMQAQAQAHHAHMHHHQHHQQQQQNGGPSAMQPQQQTTSNGLSSGQGSLDGSYREHEYLYSPLMSPAMTPHSAFTNASSLPPSVGPGAAPLASSAEFFPPLTSPALGPQMYNSDVAPGSSRLNTHRNSLQGLVDGVGALSTQLPPPSSPAGSYYSPRLGPTDAGTTTGAGAAAGRRGASSASKKARPSPLMKPTPDTTLERRRGRVRTQTGGSVEKRAGSKSVTSSPFLGPTGVGHTRGSSVISASGSSSKASPAEGVSGGHGAAHFGGNGSGASIDTPSPVDLAASAYPQQQAYQPPSQQQQQAYPPPPQQQQQYQSHAMSYSQPPNLPGVVEGVAVPSSSVNPQIFAAQPTPQQQPQQQHQQQPYQLEPMGPPPPPSTFNPVTPASFMNFSSDFDVNGLSSLSPALVPMQSQGFDSALSSLSNSPALLPQPETAFLPAMDLGGAAQSLADYSANRPDDEFAAPPPPASTSKAAPRRKSTSVRASPALKPVDPGAGVKGKGKAAANGAGAGRKVKPAAKIAPSPKIGPSPKIRPLLASGAAPDAQSRLASKSNYENILDGRGPDLLGLPQSMQSELQASAPAAGLAGTADSRRSSHKVAEQKRRDSLKLCFDELRKLLPPILPYTDELDRRPGDGNVGGQRHGELDPNNPNRGVSKVALLRRSNEYLGILRERIERRDRAISALREQMGALRAQMGIPELREGDEEVPGFELDLDHLDKEEKQAGNLAFYEDLDFDQKVAPVVARRPSASSSRRPSVAPESKPVVAPSRATGTRRSTRMSQAAQEDQAMEVEAAE